VQRKHFLQHKTLNCDQIFVHFLPPPKEEDDRIDDIFNLDDAKQKRVCSERGGAGKMKKRMCSECATSQNVCAANVQHHKSCVQRMCKQEFTVCTTYPYRNIQIKGYCKYGLSMTFLSVRSEEGKLKILLQKPKQL